MADVPLNDLAINGHSNPLAPRASPPRPRPWVAPAPSDRMDIAQLRELLGQNLRWIFGVAGGVFVLVVAVTLVSHPEFRASGRLYLGEIGSSKLSATSPSEIDLSGGAQADVSSEIEIITSRSLLSRAVIESGLNVAIVPSGWKPARYWQWLLSGRDPNVIDRAAQELSTEGTWLAPSVGSPQKYELSFATNSEYELSASGRALGHGRLGETLRVGDLNLLLAPGSAGAPVPGARYDLTVAPLAEVLERVLGALDVNAPRPGVTSEPVKVVTLQFGASTPLLAARFLSRLMAAYLQERQLWKTENASAAEAFVSKQLDGMRSSLEQIESKLASYRSSNGLVVLANEGKAMTEQLGKYEEQRVAARLQVAALTNIERALRDPDPPIEAFLLGEAADTVLEGLATSLSRARQQLTDLEARFNPSAPDVREQHAQVDAQLGSIRSYVSTRLLRSRQNLESVNAVVAQFESKLSSVPGAELGLTRLSRESEVYGRLYSYLLERQQQTAIVKASTISKNRVLDEPQPAHREASPKLPLRLASLPLGVLIGVVWVLVRGFFGGAFSAAADVRRSIGALPIYATVPRCRGPRGRARKSADEPLFEPGAEHDAAFIEAFRALRAGLYGALPSRRGGVVLVTSPCLGDGKTTCTLGLAARLAADGKRVLVLDVDLRRPVQHALFGCAPERDLGSVLEGRLSLDEAARAVHAPGGHFHSLGARQQLAVELLSSDRMLELLSEARAAYDFVLLDAPSAPLVSDALVLAAHADCVLSVLRLQHTPRRLTEEHLERLSALTESLGVIINDDVSRASSALSWPARTRPGRLPGALLLTPVASVPQAPSRRAQPPVGVPAVRPLPSEGGAL